MKQLIKKHHKIGLALVLAAIVSFLVSFFFPTHADYFIVAGIFLLFVGLFIFDPSAISGF